MASQKSAQKRLVFVLNTSIDLIEALEISLQNEGFETVSDVVTNLKKGKKTLAEILMGKVPHVVLYDIGLPYEINWKFMQKIRLAPEIGDAHFILTTTNKDALDRIIQRESHAFEITGVIGKPFDLDDLLVAVHMAADEVEKERTLKSLHNLHESSSQ